MSPEEQREKTRLYAVRWRKANREHVREMNKKYREEHKEQLKDYVREYCRTHPDYIRDNARRFREEHIEEERERSRRYYHQDRERERLRGRLYETKNREKVNARKRRNSKTEKGRAANREKMRRYWAAHPEELIIRNAVRKMFRYAGIRKEKRSHRYAGCSAGFLRNHIEEQFLPGMTWENHGAVWHVDHIVPLAWWDLRNHPEHLSEASHYSNLRPLWKKENMSKGARRCA